MIVVWLLFLSGLCIETATNQPALPDWGIVVTTTKTVLIPSGVVLRLGNSTPVNTLRLVRLRPKNY